MNNRCTIGVDLGGTDIKAGLLDGDLGIVARLTRPTDADQGPDAVINNIVGAIDELRGTPAAVGEGSDVPRDSSGTSGSDPFSVHAGSDPVRARSQRITAVGLGTPGPLSPSRGIVYRSANLPGWCNLPLREIIAERTGLPVVIDNDANFAAYGEYCVEPAVRNLVLLTLGTGVGAGTILDGRIFHGHHENASEWGHMIVHPEGVPCNCGQRGCLEMYASARNVARRVADEIKAGAASSLGAHVRAGRPITAPDVVAAAKAQDSLARRIWDEACHALALACINIQHALNPQRILLGGGMSSAGDFLLARIRSHYSAMQWHLHSDTPDIRLAALTNDAGILGAAAFARDTLG